MNVQGKRFPRSTHGVGSIGLSALLPTLPIRGFLSVPRRGDELAPNRAASVGLIDKGLASTDGGDESPGGCYAERSRAPARGLKQVLKPLSASQPEKGWSNSLICSKEHDRV